MIQNSGLDITGFICRCWYVELFLRKILIYRFECHDYTWELEISLVDETPGRIKVSLKRLYDESDKIYNNSFIKSIEPINDNLTFFSNENVINKYIPSKCPLGKNTYDKLYNYKKQLEKLFLISGTIKIKKNRSDFIPEKTTKIESLVDLHRNNKKKKINEKNKNSLLNDNNKKENNEEEAWTISYFIRGAPDSYNDTDYSFVTLDAKKCQSVYFEVDGGICCCNCGGYTYPILNIIQKTNFNELKNSLNNVKYLNISSNNNLSNSASTSLYHRIKRSFSSENDLNKKAISKSDLMTNWLQKNIYINRHTNMDEDDLEVCNYKSNNNGYNYYNYIYTSKIRNPQSNYNNKEKDLYKIISIDEDAVDRKKKIIRNAMKEYQKDIIRSKKKKEKENKLRKSEKYRILNEKVLDDNNLSMDNLFPMFDENHYCYCHCHHFNKYDHDCYQKWEHRSIEFAYFGVFIHKNSKVKKNGLNSKHNKYNMTDNSDISNDYYYSVQIPKYYGDKKDNEDSKYIHGYERHRKTNGRNNEEELDQFILQDDNDYGEIIVIPCKKYYSLLKKNNLDKVVKDNYARIITEKEMENILKKESLNKEKLKKDNQSLDIKKKSDSEESLVRVVKECFNDSITSEEIQLLVNDDDDDDDKNSSSNDSSELNFSKYGIYKSSNDSLYIKNIDNNENFHFKDYKAVERNRKNSIFYKDFQELFDIKDHHQHHKNKNNESHSRSHSYSYSYSSNPSYYKEKSHSKSKCSIGKSNSSMVENYTSDNDEEEKIRIKEIKNKKSNKSNHNNNYHNHCNKTHHRHHHNHNSNEESIHCTSPSRIKSEKNNNKNRNNNHKRNKNKNSNQIMKTNDYYYDLANSIYCQ